MKWKYRFRIRFHLRLLWMNCYYFEMRRKFKLSTLKEFYRMKYTEEQNTSKLHNENLFLFLSVIYVLKVFADSLLSTFKLWRK